MLFHAASVGEHRGSLALLPLFPEAVFSANTSTAFAALKNAGARAEFLPPDLPLFMLPLIRRFSGITVFESELNPNMIFLSVISGRKTVLLNGRMSNRNMPLYLIMKPFYKMLLRRFYAIGVPDEQQRENFRRLGAGSTVLKNTKYCRLDYRPSEKRNIIFFVSTHPEDEAVILDALRMSNRKEKVFILAPRHVNRASEIMKNFGKLNITAFTSVHDLNPGGVYLVDRMGLTAEIYARAALTFVGGSFSSRTGGHNLMEPVGYGSYTLYGPHTENFKYESLAIEKHGVGKRISDARQLSEAIADMGVSGNCNFENAINEMKCDIQAVLKILKEKG